jgi:hypothetical protein
MSTTASQVLVFRTLLRVALGIVAGRALIVSASPGRALDKAWVAAVSALSKDDACRSRPDGQTGSNCAMEALQTWSGTVQTPRKPAAHAEEDKHVEADRPWVMTRGAGESVTGPPRILAKIAVNSPNCAEWTSYFWPQLAFWSKQVGRRFRMVSANDEASLQKVQKFVLQAAYFVALSEMDPRSGHSWSEPVQAYFKQIAQSDDLEMPMLPESFRQSSVLDFMTASVLPVFFFQSLACDIDWWQKELSPKHVDSRELCWDEVQHPGFGYSRSGMDWPTEYKPLVHPEYLACQDYELNATFYNGLCPFGGHVENSWGVEKWGEGVPLRGRQSVLECRAKMGDALPEFPYEFPSNSSQALVYDDPEVDLGVTINDGKSLVKRNSTHHFSPRATLKWLHRVFEAVTK